ncbi:MAG: MTAP family purine nucleoside phosphorylase [Chloroflexi bacterium]|nr:MTAP family purine nucleoside phosphorylase [Chloroflexota bacterium]
MPTKTGFITGTGFYTLPGITEVRSQEVDTPYGKVYVETGNLGEQEIVFIPRHGKKHTISPQQINYRGNLYAMKMLGVERILATSVSGSLVPAWSPGTLILIDQFINFTYGRADSFYPMDGKLAHVAVTDPYCPTLHKTLVNCADELHITLQRGATYACLNGPRFESRAEIEMVRRLGGQLVGQTNYPECVLARELAICYATIGVVSNYAAGMQSNLTAKEVSENVKKIGPTISTLFSTLISAYPEQGDCSCLHALDEAEL